MTYTLPSFSRDSDSLVASVSDESCLVTVIGISLECHHPQINLGECQQANRWRLNGPFFEFVTPDARSAEAHLVG